MYDPPSDVSYVISWILSNLRRTEYLLGRKQIYNDELTPSGASAQLALRVLGTSFETQSDEARSTSNCDIFRVEDRFRAPLLIGDPLPKAEQLEEPRDASRIAGA
jgi:hypothetical protein